MGEPLTAPRMAPALPRGPASLAPQPRDKGDLVAGLPGLCAGVAASLTTYSASPSSACSPGLHQGTQSLQPNSLDLRGAWLCDSRGQRALARLLPLIQPEL